MVWLRWIGRGGGKEDEVVQGVVSGAGGTWEGGCED